MKSVGIFGKFNFFFVAPFTGAWIEITVAGKIIDNARVAPFTGAWIEISGTIRPEFIVCVAPFTGAWIEIMELIFTLRQLCGRSLHGSVD